MQCRAKVCGYENSPEDCASYEFLHYAAVASQTAIALMVFIILLIIVKIFKEVLKQIPIHDLLVSLLFLDCRYFRDMYDVH